MKRLIFINIISFFCLGILSAQSVNVTSPAQGVTWNKGTTHNITWTSPGCSSPNVKINIFKGSVDQANFVLQLTGPNSGSKSWTVPNNFEDGQYVIRVKTDPAETGCLGDSAVFSIAGSSITFQPIDIQAHFMKKPDLKISIIPNPESPAIYQNTYVKFKVENIGLATPVPFVLRVYMGKTNTDNWTISDLKPGRTRYMSKKLNPQGVGYILWSASADEDEVTSDSDRSNNFATLKMIVKGPDLKIINISTPDYKKTIQQKCRIRVTVKNIGHADSGKFEIDCNWKTCPLIAQGRKYKTHDGLKPGESATFEFTHRYACFGMKYPTLKVDKDNKVKEEDEENNVQDAVFHISGENISGSDAPRSINY